MVELANRTAEGTAAAEQITSDSYLGCLLAAGELASDPVELHLPDERTQRHLQCRVGLVQVPAQPLLRSAPLCDEIITMVDEQFQLPQRLLPRMRPFQLRLLEGSSGDRGRADCVRLAACAVATPLRSRQPWRYPHEPLARSNERLLEPTAHMPAVLQRPQPLLVDEALRPLDDTVVDGTGSLRKRPTDLAPDDFTQVIKTRRST